jgi:hypothetical protein
LIVWDMVYSNMQSVASSLTINNRTLLIISSTNISPMQRRVMYIF